LQFVKNFGSSVNGISAARVPQILLGDFNTYIDYEYPIELFTGRVNPLTSRCLPFWQTLDQQFLQLMHDQKLHPWHDVWTLVHPQLSIEEGFTFVSTTPGLDSCRPDRIFFNNNHNQWKTTSCAETKEEVTLANASCDTHCIFAKSAFITDNAISTSNFVPDEKTFAFSDHKSVFVTFQVRKCNKML